MPKNANTPRQRGVNIEQATLVQSVGQPPSTVKLPSDDVPLWQLTVGQLRELLQLNAATAPSGSEWLDQDQLYAEFGIKKDGADASGIPRARVGRKNRWRRADVLAAISTKAPKPRAKKVKSSASEDPFQKLLDSGEVMRGAS